MTLTEKEILALLVLCQLETVVPSSAAFPYQIMAMRGGYAKDPDIARLQGKLSMMLEVARS